MADVDLNSGQQKLSEAAATLKSFSDVIISGHDILLKDIYMIDDSNNIVNFSLVFHNMGVDTTTNAFLGEIQKLTLMKGSIKNFPVDSDRNVDGKFMKVFSEITATNLTPLPADLKVDFSILGGVKPVSFPLPPFRLNAAGDTVNIDISIFFLHI